MATGTAGGNATPPQRWAFGWVLLYAVLVLGAGFGARDPWPADEPRFALIAKEMAASGNWFIPRIAGELYPDKPPLFFWVVAGLYRITGSLRVALFLPALLAALGALVLVYDLARRLWSARTGVFAAAALTLTVQFAEEAHSGQIDGFLLGWTTLSLYGLLRHLLLGPAWGWWVVGWGAAGLGVITKGVGFLPLLLLIPFLVWGRGSVRGEWWRWLVGPLALVAVIAAWLVPMWVATTGSGDPALTAYRDEILLRQTVTRYADPWGHFRPPWYFVVNVIPVFWLPLVLLLPWLLPRWRESWRGRDLRVVLPLAWVVLVLLFFSLSPGKRGVYILPALPALVLAAAPWLEGLLHTKAVQRLLRFTLVGIGGVLLAAAVWVGWWPNAEVQRIETLSGLPVVAVLLVAAAVFLAAGMFTGYGRVAVGWAAAMLGVWLILGWWVAPRLDGERSAALFMGQVRAALPAGGELGVVGWKEQFILQAGMPVTDFGYRRPDKEKELEEALAWAGQSPGRRVLVAEDHPGFVVPAAGRGTFLGRQHRQRWWLVSAADMEVTRMVRSTTFAGGTPETASRPGGE